MKDDKLATTDKEIFNEVKERFAISQDAFSECRKNGIDDLNFLNIDQWDEDVKNQREIERRPALTINHSQTFIRRIENTLKQQRPRIKCHPVGGGADVEEAKIINGLIRHIETISNASVAYDSGGSSAIKIGFGYWRIVSEYMDEKSFDQELKIKPIQNQFSVYDDPSAIMPAGEDRMWAIIESKMKRMEYKRKYPNATNRDWSASGQQDDWETKEDIRLAEYFRICEDKDVLYRLEDGTAIYKSEYDKIIKVGMKMPLAMSDGEPISRPTTRRYVEWYRINGREVVEKRRLPGRYIPLIRVDGNVENIDGKMLRYGMVRDLKDPARMYNYWRTAETERYALAPKAPWVMAEGQADGHPEWDNANQASYSRLEYKPVYGENGELLPPPQRQNPTPIEAGMAQAAAGAEHDLSAIAGYTPENPQERAAVVSGNKYLQRRQGMADLVHWHYYDNQTYSIMMTGIMLLELIPYYYDMPRMQRIVGEDGVPKMIQINEKQSGMDEQGNPFFQIKNNMTVGKYDVVMDTGPGYATKREENAENMVNLLGTPLGEVIVKTGSDVVLRNMDFNGADVLADRAMISNPEAMDQAIKDLPSQAQNIIGALQTQLQQAQQTIQQQEMEIKYKGGIEQMKDEGQTRRKLMEVTGKAHDTERKAESEDLNSQRDFEGWMRDVHVRSQTAKDVAEINQAGHLLGKRAEHEHEERAADKMIAAGEKDRVN